MSLSHLARAKTFAVLSFARKARGDRMEAELMRLTQVHAQAVEAVERACQAEIAAEQLLRDFTLDMRQKIAAGAAVSVEAVMRARLKRESLIEKLAQAGAATLQARDEADRCLQACEAARRQLAVNQVQVESLTGLRDRARSDARQAVDDAEEEENGEIHAGRSFAARGAA